MAHGEPNDPYLQAIRRAFGFAAETGSGCRPVHFLIGIAESQSPAAAALAPADGRSVRAVVADMAHTSSAPASYLHMQAQGGARSLAASCGQQVRVEHLLVALLDQGTTEVLDALSQAGLDRVAVRQAALAALGLPASQPAITFEPVTAAGTLDRPALPTGELNQRAWAVLRWRQDHLPIGRLHRRWDAEALIRLERDAVWRLSDRLGLDDDQGFSLMQHHEAAVGEAVKRARADVARQDAETAHAELRALAFRRMRRQRRLPLLRFTVGWGGVAQQPSRTDMGPVVPASHARRLPGHPTAVAGRHGLRAVSRPCAAAQEHPLLPQPEWCLAQSAALPRA